MTTERTSRLEVRLPASVCATLKRAAFTSGHDRIDRCFLETVSQDVKRNCAAWFVLVEQDSGRIAGLNTQSVHSIPLTDLAPDLARKLPRYPSVPAVLLGRMGRDVACRGAGTRTGILLLHDAISRVAKARKRAHAICADALNDAAAAFCRRHLFQPLASHPLRLHLPMTTTVAFVNG